MKIGITMGDPSGIGPEVTLKALSAIAKIPIKAGGHSKNVIIGSSAIIDETKEHFNIQWDGEVVNCMNLKRKDVPYGRVSKLGGLAAYNFILKWYKLIQAGEIGALVTAPINKAALNMAGFNFPGHTELLANLSNTQRFAMMLCGENLRVTLVTTHVAIKEVANKLIKGQILEKIELTNEFLSNRVGIRAPKIGVSALNPHGGEGLFGDEEEKIIKPAIEGAKGKGIDVSGPYPADTLFAKSEFDAIVAMYHDQGMIPIKLREFGHAVNVTLGLPFIRTSPDHGTAFDIAGKGEADPSSMIQAIKLAAKLGKK